MTKNEEKGKQAATAKQPSGLEREEKLAPPHVEGLVEGLQESLAKMLTVNLADMKQSLGSQIKTLEQTVEKRLSKLELTMELSESASMIGNSSPTKGNSNHGNSRTYDRTLDNNDKSSALNNDKSSALNNDKSSALNNDKSSALNNDKSSALIIYVNAKMARYRLDGR
eukprot:Nk52_evm1s1031 gene=Nk52_evmTU1s1031